MDFYVFLRETGNRRKKKRDGNYVNNVAVTTLKSTEKPGELKTFQFSSKDLEATPTWRYEFESFHKRGKTLC